MGKPGGFMEFNRETGIDRNPEERIGDWEEFHGHLNEERQGVQGARCMTCGIPFCHAGILIKGMGAGCPIHNLIPEWNELIYKGHWKEAYQRLRKTNNFPEFTGRVCPAPCEGSCTAGIHEPSVAIKDNECAIADKAWKEGWIVPVLPKSRTGKKVAVIGSGPAGLACADQLNHAGHQVTVYEKEDRIGGLLMYGIPNMKLDKSLVEKRVSLMEEEGVAFLTGVCAGSDISALKLRETHDAVVLCCGASKPRDLSVPGRELKGIHFAMDFLRANTKTILDNEAAGKGKSCLGTLISAMGKEVVVIGGGDTGTDCVGTCIRQGCSKVVQLEILPKPSEARTDTNPWPEWPIILKTDYGQQEAITKFGKDPRCYQTTVVSFHGDAAGNVESLDTVQVEWQKGKDSRLIPHPVPGTEKRIKAQLILLAMGFLGPDDLLPLALNLKRDTRSNVQTLDSSYMTDVNGVFAAGDMRRGQSLVVWAIHEGRAAAKECDRHLMGETFLP